MSANIVFIDSRVTNYQTLIDGFTQPTEVHVLDAQSSGLDGCDRGCGMGWGLGAGGEHGHSARATEFWQKMASSPSFNGLSSY